jgi:hypothetical protein
MGLGTNRDYKTRDIKTTAVLKIHNDYMLFLMESVGLSREDASRESLEAINNGTMDKRIKDEEKRIRDRRNGKR